MSDVSGLATIFRQTMHVRPPFGHSLVPFTQSRRITCNCLYGTIEGWLKLQDQGRSGKVMRQWAMNIK